MDLAGTLEATPERKKALERAYLHLRQHDKAHEGWGCSPGSIDPMTGSPSPVRPPRHAPGSVSGSLKAQRRAKAAAAADDEPLTKGEYIKCKADARNAANDADPAVGSAGALLGEALFTGKRPRAARLLLDAAYEAKHAAFGAALSQDVPVAEAAAALTQAVMSRSGVAAARQKLADAQAGAKLRQEERAQLQTEGVGGIGGGVGDLGAAGLSDAAAAAAQVQQMLSAAPPSVMGVLFGAAAMPLTMVSLAILAGFTPLAVVCAGILPLLAVVSIFTTPTVSFARPGGAEARQQDDGGGFASPRASASGEGGYAQLPKSPPTPPGSPDDAISKMKKVRLSHVPAAFLLLSSSPWFPDTSGT